MQKLLFEMPSTITGEVCKRSEHIPVPWDAIADNETDTSYQQLLADTSSLQNLEQEHNLRSIYEYLQTLQNVNCTTIKKGIQALLLQQNGYTSQEISKHYGVPASHVRAWKSKARKYLQQDATLYALLS